MSPRLEHGVSIAEDGSLRVDLWVALVANRQEPTDENLERLAAAFLRFGLDHGIRVELVEGLA